MTLVYIVTALNNEVPYGVYDTNEAAEARVNDLSGRDTHTFSISAYPVQSHVHEWRLIQETCTGCGRDRRCEI